MKDKKVKMILDWPTSKEIKNIQKFLGLINYYKQFIKDFVSIARSLHNLVKKEQEWNQIDRQEKIFEELNKMFTKECQQYWIQMKIRIKVEKVTEFGERIKKVQKEAGMVLKKLQEGMKW